MHYSPPHYAPVSPAAVTDAELLPDVAAPPALSVPNIADTVCFCSAFSLLPSFSPYSQLLNTGAAISELPAADIGRVSGDSTKYLLGQTLAGAAVGLRGAFNVGRSLSYDVFAGRALKKPEYFRTKNISTGDECELFVLSLLGCK